MNTYILLKFIVCIMYYSITVFLTCHLFSVFSICFPVSLPSSLPPFSLFSAFILMLTLNKIVSHWILILRYRLRESSSSCTANHRGWAYHRTMHLAMAGIIVSSIIQLGLFSWLIAWSVGYTNRQLGSQSFSYYARYYCLTMRGYFTPRPC